MWVVPTHYFISGVFDQGGDFGIPGGVDSGRIPMSKSIISRYDPNSTRLSLHPRPGPTLPAQQVRAALDEAEKFNGSHRRSFPHCRVLQQPADILVLGTGGCAAVA